MPYLKFPVRGQAPVTFGIDLPPLAEEAMLAPAQGAVLAADR